MKILHFLGILIMILLIRNSLNAQNNQLELVSISDIQRVFHILDDFIEKENCSFEKDTFNGISLYRTRDKNPFIEFDENIIPNKKSHVWKTINRKTFWIIDYSFSLPEVSVLDDCRAYLVDLKNSTAATGDYSEELLKEKKPSKYINSEDNKLEIIKSIQLKVSLILKEQKINPLSYRIICVNKRFSRFEFKDIKVEDFAKNLENNKKEFTIVILESTTDFKDVLCIFLDSKTLESLKVFNSNR